MKRLINHLIQIQELTEAFAQQKAAGAAPSQLSELESSIDAMVASLPDAIALKFKKMRKKVGNPTVPVFRGVCTGCAMGLPVSQVHEVRAAADLQVCPSCGRFLYALPADMPRRPEQQQPSSSSLVGIARFSSPALMLPRIKADNRDDAVRLISQHLADHDFVDHADLLQQKALQRETLASTAVSNGLAFPHVRGIEGGGLTMALATSKSGLHFGPGRSLTRLIFFMVIPTAASAFYLKLLSGLCTTFGEKSAREELLDATDNEVLWKRLMKLTRKTIR